MRRWLLACLVPAAAAAGGGHQVTLDGELLTEAAFESGGRLFVPADDLARCLDADLQLVPGEGRAEIRRRATGRGEAVVDGLAITYEGHTSLRSRAEGGKLVSVRFRARNTNEKSMRLFPDFSAVQLHDQYGFSYAGRIEYESVRDFIALKPGEVVAISCAFDMAAISDPRVLVFRLETDVGPKSSVRAAVRMSIPERRPD